jgi:hypothetical protein
MFMDPTEAFNEEVAKSRHEYISHRWNQLSNLSKEQTVDGIKYLFHVNAGASVAVLAFIGAAEPVRSSNWAWSMLGCFVAGIFFIGVLNFTRFHYLTWMFRGFREDVSDYYESPMTWDEFQERGYKRGHRFDWILVFAYVSFGFFIAGLLIGFLNF